MKSSACAFGWLALLLNFGAPTMAQVVGDRITATTVTSADNQNFVINNGDRAGSNLFHSFQEFSVPTGGSAIFNVAPEVQNIFSRVTGSNISQINGLIQANGNANLFLLNPNGIIFGSQARLDIGGSFLASTAQSIRFADGFQFSATSSPGTLLSITAPIGLQLGQNSRPITVNHDPELDGTTNLGLQIKASESLSLVGGDIILNGGRLTAIGGQIQLAGLADAGLVTLGQNQALTLPETVTRSQITLRNHALVSASAAAPNSSIVIQADRLRLTQDSTLVAGITPTLPPGFTTGGIDIEADAIQLRSGNIYTGVETGLSGNGGSINLTTRSLWLDRGGRIASTNLGRGIIQDVNINAQQITVDGTGSQLLDRTVTGIYSILLDTGVGSAGNININTTDLSVINGGLVSASTLGNGNGGNVNITATGTVKVDGVTPEWFVGIASLIGSTVEEDAIGNGGNVRITASTLQLSQGGAVTGRAVGQGNGGNIRLNLDRLEATRGGQVSTTSQGTGQAGNIIANVRDRIFLSGQDEIYATRVSAFGQFSAFGGASSGLYANTIQNSSGQGGNLQIQTHDLFIQDRGLISVSSAGTGSAGNLQIRATQIALSDRATLEAETAGGNRGNLTLQTHLLSLTTGSDITTNASRQATGGNIVIGADTIIGQDNSDIVARAEQGEGGNIQISTDGLFGIQPRSQLTPGSEINASSQFGLSGSVNIAPTYTDANSGLIVLPSEVTDASELIIAGCGDRQSQFIITGRGGTPETPFNAVGNRTWPDLRSPSAFMHSPSTEKLTTDNSIDSPILEASSWTINANQQIELIATNNVGNTDHAATCSSLND
jgi:filamentous hemagglutinin family protein